LIEHRSRKPVSLRRPIEADGRDLVSNSQRYAAARFTSGRIVAPALSGADRTV